jgi:hypothetical protein
VIDIQKLAKPREMRVMVESGRSPQRRASAIVHFHIGYAAPVGICMYLQHLGAENNVRPLFSTAMSRHVVHQMLQVLSIPYKGCSHRLEDQTPGLPKACRSGELILNECGLMLFVSTAVMLASAPGISWMTA